MNASKVTKDSFAQYAAQWSDCGSFQESINMFDEIEEEDMDDEKNLNIINGADCCTFWPWFLADRPILRLFLVMGFNWMVSMAVAAIFIELEWPAQQERCDNFGVAGVRTFRTGLMAFSCQETF